MSTRVYINGRIVPPEEATISVFDRGFLYGDSVYETIGSIHGRLFAASAHITRLERSAARIGLRVPPRALIERAIEDTVAAGGNPESRVRIIVTRGSGKLDLDPAAVDDPQLVVVVWPLGAPTPEMYEKGVSVAIVSVTRNDPRAIDPAVKSGNYLNNVLALGEARRAGAYEAILCNADGSIAEGSSSNIFAVIDGELRTPPLEVGILDGITRGIVLQIARENRVPTAERRISREELRGAREAFITSATRAILPVTQVDGKPVGEGVVGPMTRELTAIYETLAKTGVP